ncbi:MAG: hypothetical protein KGN76_08935 [Acidobacteriota bacterium]|nr:hypothetical protein [Acidobacteriota bacterium]
MQTRHIDSRVQAGARRRLPAWVLVLSFVFGGLALPLCRTAAAQQRPLVTEDPETIGPGQILVQGGFDWNHNAVFPVSGLKGNQIAVPTLGLFFGLSSIAELEFYGAPYQQLSITSEEPAPLSDAVTFTGNSTHDVQDLVVATKIRVLAEKGSRPAFGVRFATKLPNASNQSGLGLDTTDFYATLLVGKTVQSVRVVGNIGVGILGDPTVANSQNDVLVYGISFARAVTQHVDMVGEVNGRANTRSGLVPPGTDSLSDLRLGARFTRGAIRFDGGVLFGMTPRDPSIGFTTGVTYVFNAFKVP